MFRKPTSVKVSAHEYAQPVVKTAINHTPNCTLSLPAAYRRHHGNINQLVAVEVGGVCAHPVCVTACMMHALLEATGVSACV